METASPVATVKYAGADYLFPVSDRPCANALTRCHDEGSFYELDLLEDSRQFVGRGIHVIDVGANLGNHTVYWAGACGAHVAAIEPDLTLGECLTNALWLNGLTDLVTLYTGVAGDGCRVRPIPHPRAPAETAGNRCFAVDPDGPIKSFRIDEAFASWSQIGVIKIDVEGMERHVIEGAQGLLSYWRPAVYAECWDHADFEQINETLRRLGYRVQASFGKTHRWNSAG